MDLKYSIHAEGNVVKAMGRDMNVSFKNMVVVSDAIRGKPLKKAIELMESVIELKKPIEYKRFKTGIGHRTGKEVKVGKYPKKAAQYALSVLRNLEANADYKGYDTDNMKVIHVQAQKGIGRVRRKPKGRWTIWNTEYCHIQMMAKEK